MAHGVRYLADYADYADYRRARVAAVAFASAAAAAVVLLHGAGCGGPIAGPEARGGASLGTSTASGGAGASAGAGAGGGLAASGAPGAPGAWRSCLLDGASPCISDAPVRLDRDLLAWSDWIGDYAALRGHEHALGVTECRWVAELEQVLLCGSYDVGTMNPPLTRAAIFVEVYAHTVVDRGDPFYVRYAAAVGGFDLLKDHPDPARPDLLHFYAAVDRVCAADRALCADAPERAMRALLERAWAGKPKFVLVTFAHRGSISDDEVVSHEILHAQYFTTPAYREAIDAYWKGLTRAQRDEIRATLAGIYNVNDEELMQNEFQAYVLMSGADRARLYGFLDQHRAAMLELLAARGVKPIAVQRRAP